MSRRIAYTASPFDQVRRRSQGQASDDAGKRLPNPQRDETLKALLSRPVDYMDSPVFQESDAEEILFSGGPDIPKPDIGWYDPLMCELSGLLERSRTPGEVRRLTGKQEQILFRRYNYARHRVRRIQDELGVTAEAPPRDKPTAAQIDEMLRYHQLAETLRIQIAELNVGLVLAMARRTRIHGVDISDLVSEGNMALLRALDKFNAEFGFKFSTYACQSIIKAFGRMAHKQSRHRDRFPVEFDPELENATNWDETRRDDFNQDCADVLGDIVRNNRCNLSNTELTIIKHRFGIADEPDEASVDKERSLTLSQVGQMVGLGKERVRQIQVKALSKIRRELESSFLLGKKPIPELVWS